MKISAIINSNSVSGTILLDNLDPISITLKHEYYDAGVKKYLTLSSVNCQPNSNIFDYSFLNPHYYTSLYIDVNNTMQRVMETEEDEEFEVENPINDHIYTENQIPEVEDVVITEIPMQNEFSALSHSEAPNLIDMEDISVTGHYTYTEDKGLRFDVTTGIKTVKTDVFELNHSSEITMAIESKVSASRARLVLINHKGEERVISLGAPYNLLGRFCYSTSITSSTKYGRLEFDYDPAFVGIVSIYVGDIYAGKTAQYFEADDMNKREIVTELINCHPTTCYLFDFDRLPSFGLRNLLCVHDGYNALKIQFSNSKVRIVKVINGANNQTILSSSVSNIKQIGVVVSDVDLKIYSDSNLIKTVSFTTPISVGEHPTDIGAAESDQDHDSNTPIKLTVSNKNSFE